MLILVNENQLDAWVRGNAEEAQGATVQLVWRLVAASCPRPRERRFPLGDSIGQHGPDGVLEADLSYGPFVPEGRSIWEIGTGLKAGDKATSDYDDRTRDTPEDTRRNTCFVFVTPLSGRQAWEHTWKEEAQADWLDKRRKRGEWKDVRVIDGTKLIDWVHQLPAVELWLAERIGGAPAQQLETPEQRWSLLRSYGQPPPLTPDLFLANRDDACKKLQDVLNDTVVQLKLTTHFPDQAIDFVCAYLASLDDETRMDAIGRSLIVSGAEAWNAVCAWGQHLILIADPVLDLGGDSGPRLIQKARLAGHAVIFAGSQGGIPDPVSVRLPMPRPHQVQEALTKAGHGDERARTLAQKSDGNLGSLLRCLQNLSLLPEWAERSDAAELAIAVMLGSWTDTARADRDVVKGIVGKAYGEWIRTLREVALRPATPLIQFEGNWKFIARHEGWYALGPRLFDGHLDALRDAAISVLRESDPQFGLPRDERYMAGIRGKTLVHSQLLRVGLAESLALLGSHPNALTSCTRGKAEATAALAVRAVLSDADWARWASLEPLLPLLAEASPGAFLEAVEKALHSEPCPFDELFAQESSGVFGRTYLSGLLWALETLAWDVDCLVRVLMTLGQLAARDPGGQWMNRPANSLTTILLPWLPQTCAPVAKRVAGVRGLLAELPDIGWRLLLTLLPQVHSVSSGTRRPEWRATIPDDWRQGATREEIWQQVSAYSELAISAAKKNVSRLAALIDHLGYLPVRAREDLLEYLASDAARAIPDEDRLRVWDKLDGLVRRHKRFPDAKWAMKPEQADRIASIADRLAPTAPFLLHQRLFSERDFEFYEHKGDYKEQDNRLDSLRQRAVEEVANHGGVEAVLAFAQVVESPWRVGIAYGAVAGIDVDGIVVPSLLESEHRSLAQFAGGFVWGRFHSLGWQWVDSIQTAQWSPSDVGALLSFLPFTRDTWERSKRILGDDESAYWTKTTANPYQAETGLELAVDRLLQYGRPYAAVHAIHKMLYDGQPFDREAAVRALLQAAQSGESPDSMAVHEIVEIIQTLQHDPTTNPRDLLSVEWAYLPLLDEHSATSPRLLERGLAAEPAFFCQVIRLVFRSSREDRPAEEPTEAAKGTASNAYRLLHAWRTPPGTLPDGTFDGDALTRWLEEVRRQCTETGHLETATSIVGHVLVYVPGDPDGLWIHRSAAAVLDARDADVVRGGYSTELYNLRGVHWVDPTGKPERELAATYRRKAESVEEAGYPRLAAALRELAKTYEDEAERVSSRDPFDD